MKEEIYTDQLIDIIQHSHELIDGDRDANVSDVAYDLLVRMIKDQFVEVVDGNIWSVNFSSMVLTTGEAHIISCIAKAIDDINRAE